MKRLGHRFNPRGQVYSSKYFEDGIFDNLINSLADSESLNTRPWIDVITRQNYIFEDS